MKITNNIMVILAALLVFMCPSVVASCEDSYWPIYAGGTTGSEDVRCFVYDPINKLIIVGGKTNSSSWTQNGDQDHGFLFALDLEANWMWGKYYYNESHPVKEINGCQLSTDGTSLAVQGLSEDKPILMDISLKDGNLVNKISIQFVSIPCTKTIFKRNEGAILYNKKDDSDGMPYFYTAFSTEDNMMFMLRVQAGSKPFVDWNYKFVQSS